MWPGLHRLRDGSQILYYGQNRSEEVTEAFVIARSITAKRREIRSDWPRRRSPGMAKRLRFPSPKGSGAAFWPPTAIFLRR